ncbi:RagB/SusD family nutrient uptake outer membrane protein [Pedobacter sp. PLR]|uniref:RagB/SusD family nutrient uptake outer membrane protein n=1 Tax=Pedobacter sp. PLR TaxID=2994465 RepID=UPI002246B77E|nr:RagB/SusD family nutrient uptake outer membrane protein [Pedobacter sp. PLR]MCX2452513.1 RagB/SusD family nutrient uptake outer membrane protein [Pedobacter sp. PLR]
MDKQDLKTIPGELIFNDSTLAVLNVNYIYSQNLPNWGGESGGSVSGSAGQLSDEVSGESKFFEGTLTNNDVTDIGTALDPNNNYGKIRSINDFLRDIETGTIPAATKNRFKAQVLFFRAYRYFDLVRLYGGVPLVLTSLPAIGEDAKNEGKLPRNSTTECMKQIIADLDTAIKYLPGRWNDPASNWGRITSGGAAAFKGRVLLTYASPQFNPGDLQTRWKDAYDANLQAYTLLVASGFGLNSSYENMWFPGSETANPEAVLVTGYNNSTGDQTRKNNSYDRATRPSYLGTGGGSNQPTWQMVKAYPMKDGKKPGTSAKYVYADQQFYKNRDPRFNATIAFNGATWRINGNANYKLWTYFAANKTVEQKASGTGFYCRKAIDPVVSAGNDLYVGTDWLEIRFAEVLLNLAESAVGINKLNAADESYKGLIDVRKRAGIEAGADNLYGLTAGMSRAQLFTALLYERQIEFAFEGKRFWDLRRWKLIESTLNGKRRTKMQINLKTGANIPTAADFANPASPKFRDVTDIDVAYSTYFELVESNLDTKYAINWKPEYYFFGIPAGSIANNPNLTQTNLWGGSFDPLK